MSPRALGMLARFRGGWFHPTVINEIKQERFPAPTSAALEELRRLRLTAATRRIDGMYDHQLTAAGEEAFARLAFQ